MTPATSPVPQETADELRRVVRRWRELPLDHAVSRMPAVRSLLADLADRADCDVPDLGPAVVMDQLAVLVYDAYLAARPGETGSDGLPGDTGADRLAARLAELRRSLG